MTPRVDRLSVLVENGHANAHAGSPYGTSSDSDVLHNFCRLLELTEAWSSIEKSSIRRMNRKVTWDGGTNGDPLPS